MIHQQQVVLAQCEGGEELIAALNKNEHNTIPCTLVRREQVREEALLHTALLTKVVCTAIEFKQMAPLQGWLITRAQSSAACNFGAIGNSVYTYRALTAVTVDIRDFMGSVYVLWMGDWAIGRQMIVAMLLEGSIGKPCFIEGTSSTVKKRYTMLLFCMSTCRTNQSTCQKGAIVSAVWGVIPRNERVLQQRM